VIGWIWASGDYATTPAIAYTVLLFVAGSADNVLKPIMLGRGVDAPMPVILIGALGGMATDGILGMFVGAAALALGYQIFMRWVGRQPGACAATGRGRPGFHCRLSRCGNALRRRSRPRFPSSPRRCCSPAAPQSGRISSGPKRGLAGRLVGRLADGAGGGTARQAASADRGMVANFDDPVLDALVAEAQRNNPNVRTAGMRILEARAQLGDCRQPALPAAAAGDRQRAAHAGTEASSGPDSALTAYNVGFDVGWEIDFWGKFRRASRRRTPATSPASPSTTTCQVLIAAQARASM
jgi:hypothetical protein